MFPDGPISLWGEALRQGDPDAAADLWRAYFPRMVGLARQRLRDGPLQAEAEDAAQSAFHLFCQGMVHGRFPDHRERDELWALLATLVRRKARARWRRHVALKHGAGQVRTGDELDALAGDELDPASVALGAIAAAELLALLPSESLRLVATWKLERYSEVEMADRLGCSVPTIKRKLALVRAAWARHLQ